MKDKIIDLEDLKTFPSELVNFINDKRKLFLKYFRAVIESGGIEESFIDSFGEDETIILSQVNDILKGYTLLQFIFKFQLVYFPYFYDDKVQKNAPIWCIVATKWCIVISQDILEIEKYQPKTRDICLF